MRVILGLFLILLSVAACSTTTSQPQTLAADGKPLPKLYRITAVNADRIQFRVLDSVNALRNAAGAEPVAFDARLNAGCRDPCA